MENAPEPRQRKQFVSALHHRLKNNLQTITSVIGVQASRAADPKVAAALRAAQNRVRAIAGVFGTHSTDDLATVHFGDYLKLLADELAGDYDPNQLLNVSVTTADIAVDLDDAIALALIANELIVNALEHAFPANANGAISVSLSYANGAAEGSEAGKQGVLEIGDTGAPLPAGWDQQQAETTGFFLVQTLTAQLRAKFSVEQRMPGKTFRLEFPISG